VPADLLLIDAAAPIALEDLNITARGPDNRDLEVELDAAAGTLTPRVFAVYPNYPNPFNPMTKISYKLPADSHVHLLVYDIAGRLVKVLAEGNQIAGAHEVMWDGKDNSGAQVASGTYFARLESDAGTAVQKLVMLK